MISKKVMFKKKSLTFWFIQSMFAAALSSNPIARVDNYAYIIDPVTQTLSIINLVNETLTTTCLETIQAHDGAIAASVSGKNLLFLMDKGILQILDVTEPLNPRILQTFADVDTNDQNKLLIYPHIQDGYFGAPTMLDNTEWYDMKESLYLLSASQGLFISPGTGPFYFPKPVIKSL